GWWQATVAAPGCEPVDTSRCFVSIAAGQRLGVQDRGGVQDCDRPATRRNGHEVSAKAVAAVSRWGHCLVKRVAISGLNLLPIMVACVAAVAAFTATPA